MIVFNASATFAIQGDGTSASLSIDLSAAVFTNEFGQEIPVFRAKNLPVSVVQITLNGSSTGITATLSGATLNVSFATAPSTSPSQNLTFVLAFAQN